MIISVEKLQELLVKPGHIDQADLDSAVKEAKGDNIQLETLLVIQGLISDKNLGKTIADAFHFKFVHLKNEKIDDVVLNLIPELVARTKGIIAYNQSEHGLKVGMRNPEDLEIIHLIEKKSGQTVLPYYITEQDLQSTLSRYKASLKNEFEKILTDLKDSTLSREERDETTVEMVDMLLQYGYQNKASDIHIEPLGKKIITRFRIDGVMHDVLEIPKELLDLILTRVKILAKMRTDEHRSALDGKLQFTYENETVDVRVSIVPVTEGENIVMRLLSARSRQFSLTDIGLSESDLTKVEKVMKSPHGMILVTGPTGSGKTTSVYAVLKLLNRREVHISTIEDPVEYDIEGVDQIQVNKKTGLTFAKGLRALVRQDPDIIMVGEIRDEETAGIAVNSAMTGHLVLSTLHANDAATTLPRLLDMGIEPFLVASTVNIAIAQRLVRKICEKCRASYQLTDENKKLIESDTHMKAILSSGGTKKISDLVLYKGAGCKVCSFTGFEGRIGIFEILEMKENVKELVIKRAPSNEIMKAAKANGMVTMLEDGMEKVLNGMTTLEEVLRVAKE